ncbi:ABC-F family ATP-binding cassette domain-containing protein [Flammeovirgaceae bacterium SG7u.111]|nr:ABC-F family ATP-binding cassette domain-containing protein [Flammeovirgaceae bacterium SG7u.132]WPO35818.1 ABC-F family ATP-binding cassette domain-containing protein [Flammeovirgaceae bacterium SG7u.111]
MNYLSISGLGKSYGERVLFQDISFGIGKGEKVALVAKNGAGKSTLLRILTGKDTPDEGDVAVNNDITLGFLEQEPFFEDTWTVADYIFEADTPVIKAVKSYDLSLEKYEEDPSEANLQDLQDATEQMDKHQAWDFDAKVKQVLGQLGIYHLQDMAAKLSGGQQKRLALSRVLIAEPDLLILDEPTNHLDLDMTAWLEEFLSKQNVTLLLVTHDRYFLDNICTKIVEIDNEKIYTYQGNYSLFLEKKAEREADEAKTVDKARNLLKTELEWMRRMPKARGTKAKYRIDNFHDLKDKAAGKGPEGEVTINTNMSRLGKKILEPKNVSKSYGDKVLVDNFSYVFKRQEKIGIVGKNGVGKSTFLNLMTQKIQPDSGTIDTGETIVFGYYEQAGIDISDKKRVIDVVREIAEYITLADGSNISAGQFLTLFLFPPKMHYTLVETLSGGEKRRLYLLTVLLKNPNFLILDEPTNDLDLATLQVLEDFLGNFPGCLIVVTHDRFFLDKMVDHLFIFEGEGKITDFNGKYTEYRDYKLEQEQLAKQEEAAKKKAAAKTEKPKEKKKGLSYKEQKEYEALGEEIEQLEEEKEKVTEEISSGTMPHDKLQEASEKISGLIKLIEEKTDRWLELAEVAEG